jgi:hypothetical protein
MATYTHTQVSTVEIHTPTQSKVKGHSMTVPVPVIAQQYSSATYVALRFHCRKGTFNVCLQNAIFFLFENCLSLKKRNLKFHKSRGV